MRAPTASYARAEEFVEDLEGRPEMRVLEVRGMQPRRLEHWLDRNSQVFEDRRQVAERAQMDLRRRRGRRPVGLPAASHAPNHQVRVPKDQSIAYSGQGIATGDGAVDVLNVQPVIPIALNHDWNLISRTIVPFVGQDDIPTAGEGEGGLGDIVAS